MFWVHAASRSSVSPVVFRRWREPFRGAKAKCCSSVRVNTGGRFNHTCITGVFSAHKRLFCEFDSKSQSKIKSLFFPNELRLDVKAQKIDKGYPRRTDAVFGGIPNDAHDVFLYKGIKMLLLFPLQNEDK